MKILKKINNLIKFLKLVDIDYQIQKINNKDYIVIELKSDKDITLKFNNNIFVIANNIILQSKDKIHLNPICNKKDNKNLPNLIKKIRSKDD